MRGRARTPSPPREPLARRRASTALEGSGRSRLFAIDVAPANIALVVITAAVVMVVVAAFMADVVDVVVPAVGAAFAIPVVATAVVTGEVTDGCKSEKWDEAARPLQCPAEGSGSLVVHGVEPKIPWNFFLRAVVPLGN
ncbi:hypothetical protein NDU88_002093 [Pleurodeles waltl]|uniref:Uncharacterized protein n=1 Tax=Pleurodeles waltl TaxID=8319 RepID=A0AAV7Q8U6_PLEWA|nr:hypothetical protein NDU88_002093 [Pleurodeles waltl]